MIQFTLKCENDHRFDSWFQSAEAFDKLKAAGMVTCETCGSTRVEKALMAPSVVAARKKAAKHAEDSTAPASPPPPGPLSAPASPEEQAMAKLKQQIEESSEYVGLNFAREARDMHEGTAPERAIYGEARADEARKLIEDGVPVTPLPFRPNRKTN